MNDYVKISDHIFPTLLAITADEQEQGLKYRDWPPPVMSFVYTSPRINKFWMYGTRSPLDIVFCKNGKIISICNGIPHSTAIIGDDSPSDLVVELPAGTCKEKEIKIGDTVELGFSKSSKVKILMSQNNF